jgi:hypothetical protein
MAKWLQKSIGNNPTKTLAYEKENSISRDYTSKYAATLLANEKQVLHILC